MLGLIFSDHLGTTQFTSAFSDTHLLILYHSSLVCFLASSLGLTFTSKWAQGRKTYVKNLKRKVKWPKPKPNLKPDNVGILGSKHAPRCSWSLAVVRRALPGRDGKVRLAVVAFADASGRTREVERAVADMILLFSPE